MMPIQRITITGTLTDGTKVKHEKPLYLCQTCMAPASYGFTTMTGNRRIRRWYCRDHKDAASTTHKPESDEAAA